MLRAPQGIAADQRALREWLPVLTIAIALTLSCPAGADVQVKHKTTSEGLGGFGNSTAEDVTVISGDRARIDTGMTFKELATKLEDAADSKVKELSASTGDASSSALFKTVTEVVSISTEAASVGSFDVPPGYTKKSK